MSRTAFVVVAMLAGCDSRPSRREEATERQQPAPVKEAPAKPPEQPPPLPPETEPPPQLPKPPTKTERVAALKKEVAALRAKIADAERELIKLEPPQTVEVAHLWPETMKPGMAGKLGGMLTFPRIEEVDASIQVFAIIDANRMLIRFGIEKTFTTVMVIRHPTAELKLGGWHDRQTTPRFKVIGTDSFNGSTYTVIEPFGDRLIRTE